MNFHDEPLPTEPAREMPSHRCDDGCDVTYCHDCGEDYTNPCERHRSFGHVPSGDPYGDGVDCQDCCLICGSGTPPPGVKVAPEPRRVSVTLDFCVFNNETDDELAERFLSEVECLSNVTTLSNGMLVLHER